MNSPSQTLAASPNPESWWSRNALWFILGILAVAFMTLILFCGGAFWLLSKAVQSNPVIELAFQHAKSDPLVIQRLGDTVELGDLITGSIQSSDSTGNADLRVPIHGPIARAELFITATKHDNQWQLTSLSVVFEPDDTRHVIIKPPD